MEQYPIHWPQFYTATILEWKFLLHNDLYKKIIIQSLKYLVDNKKIKLYAYVIMSNHIHLIWQALPENDPLKIKHSFMIYTAQYMKMELIKSNQKYMKEFKVDKKDRMYQFWKRNAMSIELFSEKVFLQKMNYIHNNPVKAGMCKYPEDYKYSSAGFYHDGSDPFGIVCCWGL
jgi:REP element-mobilizing transposase RayT